MKNKNPLIKSKKRVKDFAEVFTPDFIVKDMCDLIPSEIWQNIESTFLEPACGTGNFLVEIMSRKYLLCKTEKDGLKALNAIIGVDIQQDNVTECRERLLAQYIERFPNATHSAVTFASLILFNNIICDDFLNPKTERLRSLILTSNISNEDYKEKIEQLCFLT